MPVEKTTVELPPMKIDVHWRVGRKLSRTIYCDERFMGIMDDPDLAILVVDLLNQLEARNAPPE